MANQKKVFTHENVSKITDRIVAAFFLVYFAPLMFAVAFIVKYDSCGPVFAKRRQDAENGKTVDFWEFRTTVGVRAKPGIASPVVNIYTPLGGFLNDARLNILPRLFNALRGDISMSGLLR